MFKTTALLALTLAAGLASPGIASAHAFKHGRAVAPIPWRAGAIASPLRPATLRRYAVVRSQDWRAAGRPAAVARSRAAMHAWSHAGRAAFVAVAPASGGYVGRASYYSGGRTASGGSVGAATCAHRSLPFGTRVLVTNLANLRQMVLTVNDRGPFVGGRIMDVSRTAAAALGMLQSGVANIKMQVVGGPG